MTMSPGDVLPTQPSIVPQVVTRKRRLLLVSGVLLVVLLLIGFAAGAVWLLRGSSTAELPAGEGGAGALPAAGEQGSTPAAGVTVSPTASASPGVAPTPLPGAGYLPQAEQPNLAVTIHFTRQPVFALTITAVERTYEQPTLAAHAPSLGEPYSTLRVTDTSGAEIVAEPFTVLTTLIAEGVGPDGGNRAGSPLLNLEESDTYLVVPISSGQAPARIEIIGQDGHQFTSVDISYDTLPQVPENYPTLLPPLEVAAVDSPGLLKRASQWLVHKLTGEAEAQTPNLRFTIAIVGQLGTDTRTVERAVRDMIKTVQPWRRHQDIIDVVTVSNSADLNCRIVEFNGGRFPTCPNHGAITRAVSGVDWDTIIVVNPVQCNCGTAQLSGNITAVGTIASIGLLAHELAHSVAGMVDEYFYQFNFEGGPLGPNCFATLAACQEKQVSFPGMECAEGCRAVGQFRPHTLLMHNELDKVFGDYDECIMEKAILTITSQGETDCNVANTPPTPTPNAAQPLNYYGGRR